MKQLMKAVTLKKILPLNQIKSALMFLTAFTLKTLTLLVKYH
jgi:hypothetical protein